MLKPISKEEENYIVRNVAMACQDIKHLDKFGYRWIHIKSGFIAHYNLEGFKGVYADKGGLLRQMDANAKHNIEGMLNWRNGNEMEEKYYHQQGRMYRKILRIAKGDSRYTLPSEKDCVFAKPVQSYIAEGESEDSTYTAYREAFSYGRFFGIDGDSTDRIKDLTDITLAYRCSVAYTGKYSDDEFLSMPIQFRSGNVGTANELMRAYGDHLWDIFNIHSDRVEVCDLHDYYMEEDEEEVLE